MAEQMATRNPLALAVSVGLLVLIAIARSMPADGFYSTDTALRYLQAKELRENGLSSFEIAYPERRFDPDLEHVPYYWAYALVDGKVYLKISPVFPFWVALLTGVLGLGALLAQPILGGLLAAWAAGRLAAVLGVGRSAIVFFLVLFASPLLFYTQVAWDHAPAVGLCTFAALLAARGLGDGSSRDTFLSGFCSVLGSVYRPEAVVFAAALFVGLVVARRLRASMAFCLGALMGAVVVAVVNYTACGNPLGMVFAPAVLGFGKVHYLSRGAIADAASKTWTMLAGLRSFDAFDPFVFLFALASIFLCSGWFVRRQREHVLFAGSLACLAAMGVVLFRAAKGDVIGIFSALPVAALALAPGPASRNSASSGLLFLRTISLVFGALLLICWPGEGGTQWGSRYLLPICPLLMILVWERIEGVFLAGSRRRWEKIVCGLLITGSIFLQLLSLRNLYAEKHRVKRGRDVVQSWDADFVLTDEVFFSGYMAGLEGKRFLYYRFPEQLIELKRALREDGVKRVCVFSRDDRKPQLIYLR